MDHKLDFLTKTLVDEAVAVIDCSGIPPRRKETSYAVDINGKQFPFKLLVTEAAKLAGINLTSQDFNSSEANRKEFQNLVGYSIVNLLLQMEYFDLENIIKYKNEIGKTYDSNSLGAKIYNDTRKKLQYLGQKLGELFDIDLINNYNEKPNKMAGQGKGFVQKDYILTGFLPRKYSEKGDSIFIKLVFAGFYSEVVFGFDIDVNFSNTSNPFNNDRTTLQQESEWSIKVDENFPDNWEDLLDIISPVFEKQLKIIDSFFSHKAKVMELNKLTQILEYKKQIILQGPPGTGKTREAKLIALEMLGLNNIEELNNNDQFKLIQLHSSYTYEDFVRGIVAKPNPDGDGVVYNAENKNLGAFAEEALRNYIASRNNSIEANIEIWADTAFEDFKNQIEKEIEEIEITLSGDITLFKVENDNFRYGKNWNNPSRINFSDFKKLIKAITEKKYELNNQQIPRELSVHAHYRYTYYNALLKKFEEKYSYKGESYSEDPKNYVFVIDEINRANLSSVLGELIYALEYRGEAVKSMYAVDDNDKLVLSPNLYIIGTMNTADRSVGHIDYAIRRRFAFVDVLPKNLKETQGLESFDEALFKTVSTLFDTNLSPEFEKKDVQLGHSYFIDKSKDGGSIDIRLEYEIKPILLEYQKDGVLIGDDITNKIQSLEASI